MSPNILCLFCIRKSYSILNDCFESVLELLPQPVALQDVDDAEIEKQSLAFVITGRNSSGSENLSVNNSPVFTFCLKFGHARWATLTEKTRTFFVRQSITVFSMLYGCSRVVKSADSTKLANLLSKLLRNKVTEVAVIGQWIRQHLQSSGPWVWIRGKTSAPFSMYIWIVKWKGTQ